jgi:hypothetical protein
MARLGPHHWQLIRAQWEAAADTGYRWLCQAHGGVWPVSRETVRQRALGEGWRKRPVAGPAGRGGGGTAEAGDPAGIACPGGSGAAPGVGLFDCEFDAAEVDLDDDGPLRDAVLRQHRRDWLRLRQLASAAVAGGGTDAVRRAKLAVELLRAIQDGEAQILGLQTDRTDFYALSNEDLDRVARGVRVR